MRHAALVHPHASMFHTPLTFAILQAPRDSLRTGRILARFMIGICGFCAMASPLAAQGVEYIGTPQTYVGIVAQLKPGDHLKLAAGVYREGLSLRNLHGDHARPITIDGPKVGAPAVLLAREGRNTISLRDSAHVVIRNLLLDGASLEVHGIVAEHDGRSVSHITLERLTIVRHGTDQGIVAIATRTPIAFWTIRDNLIVGAGTGMYLGHPDGSAPFVAG